MNHKVTRKLLQITLMVTAVWYATLQTSEAPEHSITVVNDLGMTTPVTITVSQKDLPDITEKIYKKSTKKLSYLPSGGNLTLTATTIVDKKVVIALKEDISPTTLQRNEIHITKNSKGNLDITLRPKSKKTLQKAAVPKKQKVKVSKTVDTDNYWTVLITDNKGTKIAKSTFKKDTTRFASSLYVQLNKSVTDPNKEYDANKIIVYKKRGTSGTPAMIGSIRYSVIQPGNEIEIGADKILIRYTDGNTAQIPLEITASSKPAEQSQPFSREMETVEEEEI